MKGEFDMADLGIMRFFRGIEVKQNIKGIFIHQHKYALEILSRYGMEKCNKVCCPYVRGGKLVKDEEGKAAGATTFKQMVGSLMYLLATRPNIEFFVCLVSRYMERPIKIHVAAVKRIMRYLQNILDFGIWFKHEEKNNLQLFGWRDSDYTKDRDDRKSTSGYMFNIGSRPVSWSSKKQPIITLSTTEAEFVAATSCVCQ
ncbi:secreted RxLR effector protein 161-like [Vicia villosa]|uniref:secreted RxLR effector protein 161-like n=1 Tax=Vicia villosa TaxID=3911 RepID=UPI00273C745B|nr:secreted RxLR effector protein 161-like [Vicia villosa]